VLLEATHRMYRVRVGEGRQLGFLVFSYWGCLDEFPQLFD
jgi:hypothetical protein